MGFPDIIRIQTTGEDPAFIVVGIPARQEVPPIGCDRSAAEGIIRIPVDHEIPCEGNNIPRKGRVEGQPGGEPKEFGGDFFSSFSDLGFVGIL